MRFSSLFFGVALIILASMVASTKGQQMKRGLADAGRNGDLCPDWKSGTAFLNGQQPFSFAYSWGLGAGENCTVLSPSQFQKNITAGRIGFVPMIWGRGTLSKINITKLKTDYNPVALLGFNEPNHVKQSNMGPAEAARLWKSAVEPAAEALGVQTLVSPAAAPCQGPIPQVCNYGNALPWFRAFFENCTNCRVDAMATHFYGCKSLSELKNYLRSLHEAFQLPIWLTEFNCGGGWSHLPVSQQLSWMKEATQWLESTKWIVHYAWMSGRDSHFPEASLFNVSSDGVVKPTVLGRYYLQYP